MDAYIFSAALYCEECTQDILVHTTPPKDYDPDNESSWDSDEYPKGPFAQGGGEADCPQHCDSCQLFLENPLTSDGEAYVHDAAKEKPQGPVVQEWLLYYDYL